MTDTGNLTNQTVRHGLNRPAAGSVDERSTGPNPDDHLWHRCFLVPLVHAAITAIPWMMVLSAPEANEGHYFAPAMIPYMLAMGVGLIGGPFSILFTFVGWIGILSRRPFVPAHLLLACLASAWCLVLAAWFFYARR